MIDRGPTRLGSSTPFCALLPERLRFESFPAPRRVHESPSGRGADTPTVLKQRSRAGTPAPLRRSGAPVGLLVRPIRDRGSGGWGGQAGPFHPTRLPARTPRLAPPPPTRPPAGRGRRSTPGPRPPTGVHWGGAYPGSTRSRGPARPLWHPIRVTTVVEHRGPAWEVEPGEGYPDDRVHARYRPLGAGRALSRERGLGPDASCYRRRDCLFVGNKEPYS